MRLFLLLIAIIFVFAGQNIVQAQTPAKFRIIIISDNDDTLEISGIRAFDFMKILENVWLLHQQFAGMSTLYSAMVQNGAEVMYVSGSPDGALTTKFLTDNHYPSGPLFHRSKEQVAELLTTENYKVLQITSIMKEELAKDPNTRFIFVGDNGQKDPLSYAHLAADPALKDFILGSYIHKLYGDNVATPLQNGQIPYLSAAELALDFHGQNLITPQQLQSVLEDVVNSPRTAVPGFATVTDAEIASLKQKADSFPEGEIKNLLNQIVQNESKSCVAQVARVSGK